MGNPFGSSGSSGSGAPTNQAGNGLSGLSDMFANLFASNAALSGDSSGMSGADLGLFGNLDSTAFNEDTASLQATQAITPPAQAQANAAAGQDPSAGIGGTQTGAQTASTGPTAPNQPSQEQQDQEQRNNAIDELRRQLRQRQKQQQQPPQWNPRYAAATVQGGEGASYQPEYGSGAAPRQYPYPYEGESNQPEYGPGTPGASYPEGTDYQTEYGHELNLPRPGAPTLPAPGGSTSSGQVVPRTGTDVLPPRTVPGTPGAAPPTPSGWLDELARRLFGPPTQIEGLPPPGDPSTLIPPVGPWRYVTQLPSAIRAGPLLNQPVVDPADPAQPMMPPRTPTPQAEGSYRPEDDPRAPAVPPAVPPAAPAPAPAAKRKDQPKPKAAPPRAAPPPQRVWVPPTPGHYIPTPGNARGQPTWVPGTPGHYVDSPAPGQGRSPAAPRPAASVSQRNVAEVSPRLSEARAEAPEVMAYNQDARMPALLRDIAGLGFLPGLAAYANESRRLPPNTPSNVYGQGGTRPYNENWGGAAYVAKGDEVQRGRQYMGYLTGKGLTRQGAAALLGNAHQESNLSATLAPGGDGGTAAGMFQWRGPRQVAFRRWLQTNGRSESDPQAHLDFALYEMQTNPAYRASWDALHNPNMSPAQIADIIANNYEVSKRGPSQGMNNRIGFANSMLQGGGTATTVPMPIQASGGDARA